MRPRFGVDQRVIGWEFAGFETTGIPVQIYPTIDQIREGSIIMQVIARMGTDPGGRVFRENTGLSLSLEWLLTLAGFDRMIYGLWRSYQ